MWVSSQLFLLTIYGIFAYCGVVFKDCVGKLRGKRLGVKCRDASFDAKKLYFWDGRCQKRESL